MNSFNKFNVRPVVKLIESGDIENAVYSTTLTRKTKPYIMASFVGQLTALYMQNNANNDVQLDRFCNYLHAINRLGE